MCVHRRSANTGLPVCSERHQAAAQLHASNRACHRDQISSRCTCGGIRGSGSSQRSLDVLHSRNEQTPLPSPLCPVLVLGSEASGVCKRLA